MLRRTLVLSVVGCAAAGQRAFAQGGIDPLPGAAGRFLQLAQALRGVAALERQAAVNHRINLLVDYASDAERCGGRDCWQTPAETLASGRGDCEDSAILKYFLLDACGPAGCARLVYAQCAPVWPSSAPTAHVVVIADAHAADPLVLDVDHPAPQPLSQRGDLRPVFSFDTQGLWRGVSHEQLGDAAVRLLPWRGVLQRWAQQQRLVH
jgi:predicted transglutaminase-like cysteine proteinase